MAKIKSLTIEGIRGIKEPLTLELDEQSLLLYGDNGSGKSSITDAFEWFFQDKIGHLSGEEIGRGGQGALRNIFLANDEDGLVRIESSERAYRSKKSISCKKSALVCEHANDSKPFAGYLKESAKENLFLRYRDLVGFILATKKEKLDSLSGIIGFAEVSKTRDTLRKLVGELARELKRGDFDNRISNQRARIIDHLGRVITSQTQFLEALNELIAPLKIDVKIRETRDVDSVLSLIQEPADKQANERQLFYERISDWLCGVPPALDEIDTLYSRYHDQFQKISADIEKLNKIMLENLLNEGLRVIKGEAITGDLCPLCLQPRRSSELTRELEARLKELEAIKREKSRLDEAKELLDKELRKLLHKLDDFLAEKYIGTAENRELKEKIEALKNALEGYAAQSGAALSHRQRLKSPAELAVAREQINSAADFCRQQGEILKAVQKGDLRFAVQSKLLLVREAYLNITKLKREKEALRQQRDSLERVYSRFLQKQEEALTVFLRRFSKSIDDLYQFMNPDEKVENIRLVPILDKGDELAGITLEYRFFRNQESPPQKYLSESHLNCLGIALFLTSVRAFNKMNKFFILDDVISGFDSAHRKRFADLLIEKFPDYQVILMTHEKNWFEMVRNLVKGKHWLVNTLKWDEKRGSFIDEPG